MLCLHINPSSRLLSIIFKLRPDTQAIPCTPGNESTNRALSIRVNLLHALSPAQYFENARVPTTFNVDTTVPFQSFRTGVRLKFLPTLIVHRKRPIGLLTVPQRQLYRRF